MNQKFEAEYKSKLVSIEEAATSIKDGDRVLSATSSSQPIDLLNAIADRKDELNGVEIIGSFFTFPYAFLEEESFGHISASTTFMGVQDREFFFKKRKTDNLKVYTYDFMNSRRFMENAFKPTVFVCEVPEPDDDGNFSLGLLGTLYGKQAAEYSKRIILQVNKKMPYLYGGEESFINIKDVDMLCESDRDVVPVPLADPTDIEKKIASHILPHIGDGATLQLGFGGIANAIGFSLTDRKHLGIHTESYVDSMMYLEEKGVVDNSLKKIHPGVSATAFVMGSKELYTYADHNKKIYTMPISYITDTNIIAQLDNFVSINSCMNADLTGQIGSESIGLRQFSAQGGQVAFVRGANLSKGGQSFVCMRSTNKKKDGSLLSTIDLGLPYGTAVTTPRHDVDCVVTEWGCASLKYKPLNERAMEMIKIAHPDFRRTLYDEAVKNQIIYKNQAYML